MRVGVQLRLASSYGLYVRRIPFTKLVAHRAATCKDITGQKLALSGAEPREKTLISIVPLQYLLFRKINIFSSF